MLIITCYSPKKNPSMPTGKMPQSPTLPHTWNDISLPLCPPLFSQSFKIQAQSHLLLQLFPNQKTPLSSFYYTSHFYSHHVFNSQWDFNLAVNVVNLFTLHTGGTSNILKSSIGLKKKKDLFWPLTTLSSDTGHSGLFFKPLHLLFPMSAALFCQDLSQRSSISYHIISIYICIRIYIHINVFINVSFVRTRFLSLTVFPPPPGTWWLLSANLLTE